MKLNLCLLSLVPLAAASEALQPRFAHGITAANIERRDAPLPAGYQLRVLKVVRRQNGTNNSSTSRTSSTTSSSTSETPLSSYTSTIVRTETMPDGQQSTYTSVVIVTPPPRTPTPTPTQGNPGLATGVAAALKAPGMALFAGAAVIGAALL